jgi:hypothetical protein
MPVRQRRPVPPPTPVRAPITYTLAAEGPGITDEHRLTGALLERHWLRLDAGTLRAIRDLLEGEDGQGGV